MPDPAGDDPVSLDALLRSWFSLTYMLNNLNRGLGQPDAYPLVISAPVVEKLRFVHDRVAAAKQLLVGQAVQHTNDQCRRCHARCILVV